MVYIGCHYSRSAKNTSERKWDTAKTSEDCVRNEKSRISIRLRKQEIKNRHIKIGRIGNRKNNSSDKNC